MLPLPNPELYTGIENTGIIYRLDTASFRVIKEKDRVKKEETLTLLPLSGYG